MEMIGFVISSTTALIFSGVYLQNSIEVGQHE